MHECVPRLFLCFLFINASWLIYRMYTVIMGEILLTNIFFIITSVAVVLFTILVCFILYQVFKIVRTIRRIVERVEEGSELIADEVSQLRTYVLEGSLVSQIMGFFMNAKSRKASRKKKTTDINSD